MKLLYEAWAANTYYNWSLALAITVATMLAFLAARMIAGRTLHSLLRRTGLKINAIALKVVEVTKLWLLIPVALYVGSSVLDLPERMTQALGAAAIVVLMLQAAVWLNRLVAGWFEHQIEQRRATDAEAVTALGLIAFVGRMVVWILITLLILNALHIDVTALVAGLGIGGIAVALAAQNILGDLFASLSIVLDKPFMVGDFIVVGSELGTVEHIGLKTTRVRSLSGELIVFANADLLKSRIRNYRRMFERRIVFSVTVVYDTPLEKLESIPAIIRAAIEAQPKTRFDRAHLKACGDSAFIYEVVYFVLEPDYNLYMDVQQGINLHLIREFRRTGIDFAYPTQTIYIAHGESEDVSGVQPQRQSGPTAGH